MSDLKRDLDALRLDREPERRSRRWIGWGVGLIALAGAGVGAWKYFSADRPAEVEVAKVTERAVGVRAQALAANGYVVARRRATVSSKITGKVVEVNVEEGMAVKEGQILARLDDANYRAQLALAEAQVAAARRAVKENEVRLNEAKVTLGRMTALLKEGVVGQADVDAVKASADSISARISAL